MRRDRKGDRKMVKYLHDSQKKNKLITGRCIPIDIYEGSNKERREVDRDIL